MDKRILKIISLWFLAHATIWIVFIKLITHSSFTLALLYFSFCCFAVIYLFRDIFLNILAQTKRKDALLIVLSLAIHALTYWLCHHYLTAPVELLKTSTASFIQVDRYFIWVKPLDALVQQVMLIVLITLLHKNNVRMRSIALLLGVLFGVAHIVSIERLDLSIAIAMTASTTAFALLMPYMLLKVRNGYIYNFMIHLLLVDLAALVYWGMWAENVT